MILVRRRPSVFLDAVFKPFFLKSSMARANNWRSIGRIFWRMASFKSFNVGVCECKHSISNTPKGKKSHVERSGERGGHGTSPKREIRCPGNMLRTMVIDSSLLLLKWPTQRKKMPTTSSSSPLPSAYVLSTTYSKDVRFPWVTLYRVCEWPTQ